MYPQNTKYTLGKGQFNVDSFPAQLSHAEGFIALPFIIDSSVGEEVCNPSRKLADVNWESTLSLHHEEVTTCLPVGRFTESQIVTVLQKAEQGQKIAGFAAGLTFFGIEISYDASVMMLNETANGINQLDQGLRSGWVPFRY